MSLAPRVSVVIPTHDRAPLVAQAIGSVLAQTFPDLEVIVCDDGSRDDTEARVREFGPPVRYLRVSHSGRAGATRNRGVEAASASWIAFLDDDDLWEPEKLARLFECVERDPGVGVVYSDRRVLGRDGSLSGPVLTDAQKRAEDFVGLALAGLFPQLSSVLVRKDLLRAVGGFDEALLTGEDLDLWLRLPADTRAACVPEPLVTIRRQEESLREGSGTAAITNAQHVLQRRLAGGGLTAHQRRCAHGTLDRLQLSLARALLARGDTAGARRAALRALKLGRARPSTWPHALVLWFRSLLG